VNRRAFITLVGGVATAWPLAARAQQPERVRRLGVLMGYAENDSQAQAEITAFRQGLQRLGWTGRNLRIAYRWGHGELDRARTVARELIALRPEAVLAASTPAVKALSGETRTVPIVFVRVGDPLGDGLVDSMASPGGNVTGFSTFEVSIAGKWLQLLKEIAPSVERATFMFNPATAPYKGGSDLLQVTEAAALSVGVKVSAAPVHDVTDIERVIAAVASEGNGGLISAGDLFVNVHRNVTIELTARYRVPAIYQYRYFATEGGLISYGSDVLDQYARAAEYIDRILKGAKPTDLPVQAPIKYELVINLKTAKALGLTVPDSLLARADEVIE
jgi:putative tryptophan/tyrosine transport system substrate-binding protein